MKKYKFTPKEDGNTFNKHGIDITIFPTNISSASVVHISVEEGHFQEFYDKESHYIYSITEGEGTFVLNDEKVEVQVGDMIVAPPKTRIHYFGKMKMVLTVTPAFKAENEVEVRLMDKSESPYLK